MFKMLFILFLLTYNFCLTICSSNINCTLDCLLLILLCKFMIDMKCWIPHGLCHWFSLIDRHKAATSVFLIVLLDHIRIIQSYNCCLSRLFGMLLDHLRLILIPQVDLPAAHRLPLLMRIKHQILPKFFLTICNRVVSAKGPLSRLNYFSSVSFMSLKVS